MASRPWRRSRTGRASSWFDRGHTTVMTFWWPCRTPASGSIQERRPAVQRLLYHEARRHGHGAVDQPLHHRRAWGTALGDTEPQSRRDVSLRSAGDTMTPGSPIVFVVDDDAAVRDGLRRLISSVGLGVEVFPTAQAFRAPAGPMLRDVSCSTCAFRG